MGLENRRSGNASEGSNPSLSASFPADQPVSAMRISRCSAPVPADADGTLVGTPASLPHGVEGGGKLLPCPFCGGRAEIDHDYIYWIVYCKSGDHEVSSGSKSSKDEAIAAWNTRSLPTGGDDGQA